MSSSEAKISSDIPYPDNKDLRSLVRFDAATGQIWQDEDRMLLLHASSIAGLRRELIVRHGKSHARTLFTKMGYASGVRDAILARKIRQANDVEAFLCGPQLHMLKGIVRVRPQKLRMDIAKGTFYGEFVREHSWEDDICPDHADGEPGPNCWTQIGYSTGFTSSLMGKWILFKEVECVATGGHQCMTVGKPLEEWDDADEQMQYFGAESDALEIPEHPFNFAIPIEARKQLPRQLVGGSPNHVAVIDLISKAAKTKISVLLLGETGVGKELLARTLHDMSPRANQPFVAVNCAAIPPDLIESELFGVERGAYTGANQSRPGRFERADGGTIFLDEIGELPGSAQSKLLRALHEGEIERLGGTSVRSVNVRVVAATNVELKKAMQVGAFRRDLYYRLNAYTVLVPPLRERPSDILPLAQHFLEQFSSLYEKNLDGFSERAMKALQTYAFPGNIRELSNMVERGVTLARAGSAIQVEDLFGADAGPILSGDTVGLDLFGMIPQESDVRILSETMLAKGISLGALEDALLRNALAEAGGNLSAAARRIGISRAQFEYRLKKLKIVGDQ